jgi:hypothetical protein
MVDVIKINFCCSGELTTAANFTAANAVANVDAYAAIPVEVLDAEDMAIYMGRDYFRVYNCT